MSEFYTATDHFVVLPGLLLAFFGCALLLIDFIVVPDLRQKKWLLIFLLIAEAFTAAALWRQHAYAASAGYDPLVAFRGALVVDGFSLLFNWMFVAATALVALISYRYLEVEEEHHGEYYALLLLAQAGMFFLAAATELVTILVGLELMAVAFYILVGFLRNNRRSNEAAMKYLLLGAFSSGFLAYGFSILYGLSGSTRLDEITRALAARDAFDPLVLVALVTTGVGLLFKVAIVPFHMWAPDVYEGAPTTVTAYLSVASKAASFAFLLRIFLGPFWASREAWEGVMAGLAVLTLTAGNLAAITQRNVKRLLAYSSISHAGYALLGLVAGNQTGIQGLTVYILVYVFMNLGAFLVIVALCREPGGGEDIEDLNGLASRHPAYAALMVVFLLSLAGIPPTAGFIAKYYIFVALIEAGQYVVAAIAAAYVAVSLYYYFRIVRRMFTGEAPAGAAVMSSLGLRIALGLTAVATLGIGIYPQPLLNLMAGSLVR
jgi:NADH-quinone oxidoreductase subunit N